MKKILIIIAVAISTATAFAQTVLESKTFDNIFVGVNGGVGTATTGHKWLCDLNPNAGVRIGRNLTPVFGWVVEGNAYFSDKPQPSTGTFVRFINTDALATVNLTTWIGGYKGEPRFFEVIAVGGAGWGHSFNNKGLDNYNRFIAKTGFDFTFNFGREKAWQLYVEPAFYHALNGNGYDGLEYNIKKSMVQFNAGVNYKFRNSTGSHNFVKAQLRDQTEIDRLNATINELRNKPAQVKYIERENTQTNQMAVAQTCENIIVVTFAQGKSELTEEAKEALSKVKEGAHVQVIGTASPEGKPETNQKLSQARADTVSDFLKARCGAFVDESVGKGVQGTTSNRLAIVYVK